MDWTSVLNYIISQGMTQTEIARHVVTSPGHINDLLSGRRGDRVGYELGIRLLKLKTDMERKQKRFAARTAKVSA